MFFFFFNDTATTEIYTLSLHDALPILLQFALIISLGFFMSAVTVFVRDFAFALPNILMVVLFGTPDRKSTRLNSSHLVISYAVFCLKKKKNIYTYTCHPLTGLVLCCCL